jgi:hypothetical protein
MSTLNIDIIGTIIVDGNEEEVTSERFEVDIYNPDSRSVVALLDNLLHNECKYRRISDAKRAQWCFMIVDGEATVYVTKTEEEYFRLGYNGSMCDLVEEVVLNEINEIKKAARNIY